ncbi:alpha/beta hydrolase [Nocardia sp. NPDC050378]|uniref:alpha/beta hydrolase n=1 Tax=Nocardia sp. NPDC050378 TaxID=3155400 RepID=UPI0033FFEF02
MEGTSVSRRSALQAAGTTVLAAGMVAGSASAKGVPGGESAVASREVSFDREGVRLAGLLFTPAGFEEGGRYPALIVQGSFTSVKEQMPQAYARKFAQQGFVALAFDYAHYGASGGQPRQFESPAEKLADLKAAVTYLDEQPFVQAVGMVGVCTSASNGVYLVAEDSRVKAFATIAGFLTDADTYTRTYGEDGLARRRSEAAAAREKFEATGQPTTLTVYSETDETAVNYNPTPGAYDYYTNPARGNVATYRNEFDVSSWDTWTGLDALSRAPQVTTPTMVVHSDGCASPEQAKRLHEAVRGEKELVWADGNHFDYYDSPAQMGNAVANVARFFHTHLA